MHSFRGIGKSGQEYSLINAEQEPIYGYQGRRHTKLYRPFSGVRFLFTGEMSENYVFGYEQLPVRGDILFFTGGEKDVISLAAHGFNAICMNSETAIIPKKLLCGLSYRFKHLVLLYDMDKTGPEAMERLRKEYADFIFKSLILTWSTKFE